MKISIATSALLLVAAVLSMSKPAVGQTPLIISTDQHYLLSSGPVFDSFAWYDSAVAPGIFPFFPASVDLTSFHFDLGERAFYATVANPMKLVDGTYVTPRDILTIVGNDVLLETPGDAIDLPTGIKIDALFRDGGEWILSFDVPTTIDGERIDDADLVRIGGPQPEVIFSAADRGLPVGLDLDAAHIVGDDIYMSFDQPGSVDGISFDDDSVMVFSRDDDTWRLHQDASQFAGFPSFAGVDIDAISMTPELFGDSFENGSTTRWTRVVQ